MQIEIPIEFAEDGFIHFLKRRILGLFSVYVNEKKLIKFNDVFEDIKKNNKVFSTRFDPFDVLFFAMSHLSDDKNDDGARIYIDEELLYPGTQIKVITLCKVITYGTMNVSGYPLLLRIFNHIERNIEPYAERFTMGVGII